MPTIWTLPSRLTVVAFIGLLGLISTGCSNPTPVNEQTNGTTITVPSKSNQANGSVDRNSQASNKSAASKQVGLQENMPYAEARSLLIQQGWEPHVNGDAPNLDSSTVRALFDLGYEEVKDCAGTGLGPCRFEFINDAGELLVVSAIEGDGRNGDRVVWRWFIEEQPASNPQHPSPSNTQPPFFGTRYFNFYGGNGTGQSITIEQDGATTVESHGTASSSVEFRGQFSNPLTLSDGTILRLDGDKIYQVSSDGQIIQGCNGENAACESGLYEASASWQAILDGRYVMGGTDQGLEVSGDQYRYYDEMGEQAWRPLSELTYMQEGLIFDGNHYWCAISSENGPGVCTENGWSSAR